MSKLLPSPSQIATRFVLDSDAATKRLLTAPNEFSQQDGYRVVDLSDPVHPKISVPVVGPTQFTFNAALGPDYFVLITTVL